MPRIAFKMILFDGMEAEYTRRHKELWPELEVLLKSNGISDYSIFLDAATNELFGVLHAEDTVKLDALSDHPVMKKWWTYMKDIMETNEDESPVSIGLTEVFYMQ